MNVIFLLGLIALVSLPWTALVAARNRNDLEAAWYGLVAVGMAAAVIAFTVQIGFGTMWISLTQPTVEDVHRVDLLLLTCLLPGILLELCKIQGLYWFQSRLNRGNWVLHGLAVGAGSGFVQAIWLCGAVALTIALGQATVGQADLWLLLRCGALIAMETCLTGLAMLLIARGLPRARAVLRIGALHGVLRLLALTASLVPGASTFGQTAVYAAAAAAAAWWLHRQIQQKGWPV